MLNALTISETRTVAKSVGAGELGASWTGKPEYVELIEEDLSVANRKERRRQAALKRVERSKPTKEENRITRPVALILERAGNGHGVVLPPYAVRGVARYIVAQQEQINLLETLVDEYQRMVSEGEDEEE